MTNREIKFRAWGTVSKSMMYWDSLRPHLSLAFEQAKRDAIVLMQFTGLKDKNGKEIYEGDVVEYPSHRVGSKRKDVERGFIDYSAEDAMYWIYFKKDKTSFTGTENLYFGNTVDAEVIGNIYENPSLLQ